MRIFEPARLGNGILKNRLIRSATFEGMSDKDGFPTQNYKQMYSKLAQHDIGTIITGFSYITKDGKAAQPGQAGIDSDDKIVTFKEITNEVHKYNTKIFLQIAHTGRQTLRMMTENQVLGVSGKKSPYFKEIPLKLTTSQVHKLVQIFSDAAYRAKKADFDGVQLHAAHGYLIHQFILPSINNRKDIFGIDKKSGIGTKFLELIIKSIRQKCGDNYPILVKISAGDDYLKQFSQKNFIQLIRFLDIEKVAGIEISYGTMDYPLNIFRGESIPLDRILKHNLRYKTDNALLRFILKYCIAPFLKCKIKRFSPGYNLPYAKIAKKYTEIPVICVGGFREGRLIKKTIDNNESDFVSLCRPFIREPDFAEKLSNNENYISKCINCNICAVMCDSEYFTRCYNTNQPKEEM